MPDWTYIPLREPALMALRSPERVRRSALRFVSGVARVPGGGALIRAFDHTRDLPEAAVEVDGWVVPASDRPGGCCSPVASWASAPPSVCTSSSATPTRPIFVPVYAGIAWLAVLLARSKAWFFADV